MATDMQIVMIVFRNSLEDDVLAVLRALDVVAHTDFPKVFGVSEADMAFHSLTWPGFNSMLLAALEDSDTAHLVWGLVAFRDTAGRDRTAQRSRCGSSSFRATRRCSGP
jgi:hypothetical protein